MTGHFRPRFDYETEVEAAEDGEKEMLIKLGLEEERTSRSSSKRTTGSSKDTSKKTTPTKDDPRLPGLPFPKKPPLIPAPILPF